MDIVSSLVGGQACAADGTTTTRNPLSRLVDTLIEGSAGSQQKGPPRRVPVQGEAMRGPLASRAGSEAGTAAGVAPVMGPVPAGPQAGAMGVGPVSQVGAVGPPGRWMGPVPAPHGHPAQAFPQVRWNH